jgi:hypothetical protein
MNRRLGGDAEGATPPPIFIQGILGRSGTNYLARLLDLHPDCQLAPIPEDWLLAESHHIMRFARAVSERWHRNPTWDIPPDLEAQLVRRIGAGMQTVLGARINGKRVVTKTPNVQWLENFFQLFPEASLLILVRDGRSIAESAKRSFGHEPSQVARWWAWGARQILSFDRANRGRSNYRLVRYEDLAADPKAEMAKILRALDLDLDAYDFSQIESLPVFGSGNVRNEAGEWEWKISPPNPDTGRVERWQDWSREEHERFNWITGDALRAFGYEPRRFGGNRIIWWLRTALWATFENPRRARAWLSTAIPTWGFFGEWRGR